VANGVGALEQTRKASTTSPTVSRPCGFGALAFNTTGSFNLANGFEALGENTEGNDNTAEGHLALYHATGSANVGVAVAAGENVEGSGNVEIANRGTSTDENTIRIGASQTRAFMAGIFGTPLSGLICNVGVSSEGQLGCVTGAGRTNRSDRA